MKRKRRGSKVNIGLFVEPELKEKLLDYCAQNDVSQSEAVLTAIETMLAELESGKVQLQVVGRQVRLVSKQKS